MTPQEYIESQLQRLSEKAPAQAGESDVVSRIYALLMSKKFRKFAVPNASKESIRKAIQLQVEKDEPIKIGFPFGGYKLWRLEESPEPDFAELFSLIYYAQWIKPIGAIYPPGLSFAFCSDAIMVERLNNIPKSDVAQYEKVFRELLAYVNNLLPRNIHFKYAPLNDLYTEQEFNEEVDALAAKIAKERKEKNFFVSEEAKRTIELNVRKTAEQERDPNWLEKVELVHEAMMNLPKRRPQYRGRDIILAFPISVNGNCIAIGTTKTSVAKFWVGVGALQRRGDGFIETVLSPSQLEKAVCEWNDVSLPHLTGKNFKRVRLIDLK